MSKPDVFFPPGVFHDIRGERIADIVLIPPNDGAGISDIFKTSHVQACAFEGVQAVAQSHDENGWDANRYCQRNIFKRLVLPAGGSSAVYVKCGFKDNIIDDVLITRYAKHSDIIIGDYSDSGGERCARNKWNDVRRIDGKPVRVRWSFLRAEKPKFTNSKVKYQYGWSLLTTLYGEAKYLWVFKTKYLQTFKGEAAA